MSYIRILGGTAAVSAGLYAFYNFRDGIRQNPFLPVTAAKKSKCRGSAHYRSSIKICSHQCFESYTTIWCFGDRRWCHRLWCSTGFCDERPVYCFGGKGWFLMWDKQSQYQTDPWRCAVPAEGYYATGPRTVSSCKGSIARESKSTGHCSTFISSITNNASSIQMVAASLFLGRNQDVRPCFWQATSSQ